MGLRPCQAGVARKRRFLYNGGKEGNPMAFDFKKEYKEFYLPKNKPAIVTVPPMAYIAVRGKGDPN